MIIASGSAFFKADLTEWYRNCTVLSLLQRLLGNIEKESGKSVNLRLHFVILDHLFFFWTIEANTTFPSTNSAVDTSSNGLLKMFLMTSFLYFTIYCLKRVKAYDPTKL